MAGPRSGSSGGRSITAAIASTPRGGSNLLAGKGGPVRVGGVENPGFSSVVFSNPRGEAFSSFLKSVKGNDGGAAPLFPFRPLTPVQTKAIRESVRIESPSVDAPANPVVPVQTKAEIRATRPSNILFFPIHNLEQSRVAVKSETPKAESGQAPEVRPVLVEMQGKGSQGVVGVEIRSTPTKFPERSVLEQQLLLSRAMRSFARTRVLPRGQAIPMVNSEPQVEVKAGRATLPGTGAENLTQTRTEVLQRPSAEILTGLRNINSALARSRRQLISYEQEKAVIDEKTNKLRVDALITARDRLRSLGKEDSRLAIVSEAGISYLRDYRSPIVERFDGTQLRIAKDILAGKDKDELTNEKILAGVLRHPALKRDRHGVAATSEQIYEVITDPERPFIVQDKIELLPITKSTKNTETGKLIKEDSVQASRTQAVSISETVEEVATNEMAVERNLNPVQLFVDNVLYIKSAFQSRTNIMEAEERAA